MGTSVSLVGGGLTIGTFLSFTIFLPFIKHFLNHYRQISMLNQLLAGGILTIATAGVATPVLIAGRSHVHLEGGFRKVYNIGFFSQQLQHPDVRGYPLTSGC